MDPELSFWGFVWTKANSVPLFLITELFILFISIAIVIVFDQFGWKLQLPADPAADWNMMLNHKWTDIHYLYLCSTDKICGLIFAQQMWLNGYNGNNMAPKQRDKTAYIVSLSCGAMSRILHITKMEQFVIDSHDTIAPHDNFVMWWKIAWHVLEFCSTHNLCGVCDEYGVCRQTYENIRIWHLSVVVREHLM